mgnify:CR=1 FL=1
MAQDQQRSARARTVHSREGHGSTRASTLPDASPSGGARSLGSSTRVRAGRRGRSRRGSRRDASRACPPASPTCSAGPSSSLAPASARARRDVAVSRDDDGGGAAIGLGGPQEGERAPRARARTHTGCCRPCSRGRRCVERRARGEERREMRGTKRRAERPPPPPRSARRCSYRPHSRHSLVESAQSHLRSCGHWLTVLSLPVEPPKGGKDEELSLA